MLELFDRLAQMISEDPLGAAAILREHPDLKRLLEAVLRAA